MDDKIRALLDAADAARKAVMGTFHECDWEEEACLREMLRGVVRFVRRYAVTSGRKPGDFDERLNGRSFIELKEDGDE